MSVSTTRAKVNAGIRNYPVQAFQDMLMNTVLNEILDLLSGGGGGSGSGEAVTKVTSANFTDATNCPITSLAGDTLAVYWNDTNKFLELGTDFDVLVGGGFNVLISGFDSSSATYTFYVFVQV